MPHSAPRFMRISTKVSLSLALLGLAVFGGIGALQLVIEKRDLEQALVREASTLCRATAESLRQDLREHEPVDSDALLESLERFEQELDVTVWHPDAPSNLAASEAGLPSEVVDAVGRAASATGELVTTITERAGDRRAVVVASPIDPVRAEGAVVLVRPLDSIDADLRREAEVTASSVLVFSVLGGLLGFVLGEVYIRRPLERLDRAMAGVAGGDLDAPLSPGRRDEVGRALERFDQMRQELQRARVRLQAEQDAHRTTLERLADADRLAAIGHLAAGLAHEIGSPLQILNGRAQKLAKRVGHDAYLAQGMEIIVAQTERITRVVRQLLEFARPRARERRSIEPVACVRAVVDLLELETRRREVSVRLDARTGGEVVEIDPDAIQQIVFNLVRNSLAALDPGGWVEIGLVVEPAAAEAPRGLVLRVVDNGRGIPDDVRARIFEPFFTTRGHDGGIGLGLAVVRALVDTMQGTVAAMPRDEGGTELVVRLPC